MEIRNYAIILDTNCFGDINKYNFKKSKTTICVRSFKNFSNIDIYLPSIVYEEIKKHIKESIILSKNKIESIYLKNAIDDNFISNIYNNKVKELDEFIDNNKIKIIDCNKYVNIEEVNKWYFNMEKPFEPSKPKEFPDAMILSSIKNYFDENKYDKVIAISNDLGFSEGIKKNTLFDIESDIGNIMNEILGIKDTEIRNCQGYIVNQQILTNKDVYIFESFHENDNFIINNIKYEITDFEVIEKELDYYLVSINCKLTLNGDFNLIDPILSYNKDSDTLHCRNGSIMEIEDAEIYLALNKNKQNKIIGYEPIDINVINLTWYIEQLDLKY